MGITGNGEEEVRQGANQFMVGGSLNCHPKGKLSMQKTNAKQPGRAAKRREPKPVSAQHAVEILQSAVAICQRAGLSVWYEAGEDGLRVLAPDVNVVELPEGARFTLREVRPTLLV